MKTPIQHPIAIPTFYWKYATRDKLLFKRYLHAYIKRNHPDLKVSEIVKGKILCTRRDKD